jgi:hypothetical protein
MPYTSFGFGAEERVRSTKIVESRNPNPLPQHVSAADLLQSFTVTSENPVDAVAALVHHVIFRGQQQAAFTVDTPLM